MGFKSQTPQIETMLRLTNILELTLVKLRETPVSVFGNHFGVSQTLVSNTMSSKPSKMEVLETLLQLWVWKLPSE